MAAAKPLPPRGTATSFSNQPFSYPETARAVITGRPCPPPPQIPPDKGKEETPSRRQNKGKEKGKKKKTNKD